MEKKKRYTCPSTRCTISVSTDIFLTSKRIDVDDDDEKDQEYAEVKRHEYEWGDLWNKTDPGLLVILSGKKLRSFSYWSFWVVLTV